METSNSTNDALQLGYIYEYTVTSRSNVEGATNGTSVTVIGMCWGAFVNFALYHLCVYVTKLYYSNCVRTCIE